jgi:hypothetical protein
MFSSSVSSAGFEEEEEERFVLFGSLYDEGENPSDAPYTVLCKGLSPQMLDSSSHMSPYVVLLFFCVFPQA